MNMLTSTFNFIIECLQVWATFIEIYRQRIVGWMWGWEICGSDARYILTQKMSAEWTCLIPWIASLKKHWVYDSRINWVNINLFTDTQNSSFVHPWFLDCDNWLENENSHYSPFNLTKLSEFMDQKSSLISIQINHVHDLTYTYRRYKFLSINRSDFLRR